MPRPGKPATTTIDVINDTRYHLGVIKTFANRQSAEIWTTGKTRGAPPASVTKRKLAILEGAMALDDLKSLPGNRLEKLRSERQGQYSIRISDQYRICFVWRGYDAFEAEIADHH